MSTIAKAVKDLRRYGSATQGDIELADLLNAIDSGANDQDIRDAAERFATAYLGVEVTS